MGWEGINYERWKESMWLIYNNSSSSSSSSSSSKEEEKEEEDTLTTTPTPQINLKFKAA